MKAILWLALMAPVVFGQEVVSPEVHGDRRVTFRLHAPNVPDVQLWGEWILKFNTLESMTKGDDGTWTVTVGPLTPGIYTYTFVIDHLGVPDPRNHLRAGDDGSLVEVPSDGPALYDAQAVPHGVVHLISYQGKLRPGVQTVVVYTPPGYERDTTTRYPALYLLHGSGDTEISWTQIGRAHFIADNLIAKARARPMILVMPNGFGDQFERELIEEIVPLVEARYRVKRDARDRAVAGLSMGGFQALAIAVKHPEVFGTIGVFSAGAHGENAEGSVRDFALDQRKLANGAGFFRIVIGDRDVALKDATRLDDLLQKYGVKHEMVVVPGEGHRWIFWRQCLADFLPALFRSR
jgi:enterochelin esterase family protein